MPNDLISDQRARDLYGVVIDHGEIDLVATDELRRRLQDDQVSGEPFDFGLARTDWMRRHDMVNLLISQWVWSLPDGRRHEAKVMAYLGLAERGEGPYKESDFETVIASLSVT